MQSYPEVRHHRVLVVDDDPLVLELVVKQLNSAGYQTLEARDGFEAMRQLEATTPSAMILDINMPRCDGFEVLRTTGQSGLLAKLPTLVLTARNQPADVQKAIQLGASDYLGKPFNNEQLLSRVARLLRRLPASTAASRLLAQQAGPQRAPPTLD